jgi:6-phosphogluconolactonase
MVRRSLLGHLPVAPAQVFPMTTTAGTVWEAAEQYADELALFFGRSAHSSPPPCFDLVLLGLGDDGHTASLFPGMPALNEAEKWVAWSPPGTLPPPVDRITLTFPVLNAARQILFLVAGERKAGVLKEVLEDQPPPEKYPATGVRPFDGAVTWLLDAAAAAGLSRTD